MTFPVQTIHHLPQVGASLEHLAIDFKLIEDPAKRVVLATDMAAFANASGGTIFVGGKAHQSRLVKLEAISRRLSGDLAEAYSQAASQLCVPSPRLQPAEIEAAGTQNVFLAVNVWPSPIVPVGVHDPGDHARWKFPLRVGSHTSYLRPDQFGTLESVATRRTAALLASIPEDQKAEILLHLWLTPAVGIREEQEWAVTLLKVASETNTVEFEVRRPRGEAEILRTPYSESLAIPLDLIEAVWKEYSSSKWHVVSNAMLRTRRGVPDSKDGRLTVIGRNPP